MLFLQLCRQISCKLIFTSKQKQSPATFKGHSLSIMWVVKLKLNNNTLRSGTQKGNFTDKARPAVTDPQWSPGNLFESSFSLAYSIFRLVY